MVQKVLLLALAGAVGTLTRFGLSGIVRRYNTTPSLGTFAVNMTGCFLVGFSGLSSRAGALSPQRAEPSSWWVSWGPLQLSPPSSLRPGNSSALLFGFTLVST